MMAHAALDTGPARLAGSGYPRVDDLSTGDELRFPISDNEHVVGVVVHLGAAPYGTIGADVQAFIVDDGPTLDENGCNLVVVYIVNPRRKAAGSSERYEGGSREYCGDCE
jgi:hypothetical protein